MYEEDKEETDLHKALLRRQFHKRVREEMCQASCDSKLQQELKETSTNKMPRGNLLLATSSTPNSSVPTMFVSHATWPVNVPSFISHDLGVFDTNLQSTIVRLKNMAT